MAATHYTFYLAVILHHVATGKHMRKRKDIKPTKQTKRKPTKKRTKRNTETPALQTPLAKKSWRSFWHPKLRGKSSPSQRLLPCSQRGRPVAVTARSAARGTDAGGTRGRRRAPPAAAGAPQPPAPGARRGSSAVPPRGS